eukprot:Gb_23319 [translate_table: standard]
MKGFSGFSMSAQSLILLGLIAWTGSALSTPSMLGVVPQDIKRFELERIMCKDGSKSFSRDRLNDNFCDCADGTDEPGTSACPEGKFYCINAGDTPLRLFSSRVNDGICDCCDGSDEYHGKVRCPNTCRKVKKVLAEKLHKGLSAYKEGFTTDKQDRERAKQMILAEEAELASLKQDDKKLKDIMQKLKDLKVFLVLELVIVASILLYCQGCCKHHRAHPRSRRRFNEN